MPSASKEGRRRLCAVLSTVEAGSETLVEGRPAKVKSNWGRSSWTGDSKGWGEAEGSGIGCGREASRREAKSFNGGPVRPRDGAVLGLAVPTSMSPSGVGGMDRDRTAST